MSDTPLEKGCRDLPLPRQPFTPGRRRDSLASHAGPMVLGVRCRAPPPPRLTTTIGGSTRSADPPEHGRLPSPGAPKRPSPRARSATLPGRSRTAESPRTVDYPPRTLADGRVPAHGRLPSPGAPSGQVPAHGRLTPPSTVDYPPRARSATLPGRSQTARPTSTVT